MRVHDPGPTLSSHSLEEGIGRRVTPTGFERAKSIEVELTDIHCDTVTNPKASLQSQREAESWLCGRRLLLVGEAAMLSVHASVEW